MYVSVTTQTPRSSFPQMPKSILYPHSQLHDAIDPSKGNLKQQRQNLKLKKEKLANNVLEIEEQLHRIAKQSGIVQDLEESLRLMNSLPIFQMNCEFKEANSQRSILAKFGSDLKQQIDYVQSEIDEATYKLKQKSEKPDSEETEDSSAEQSNSNILIAYFTWAENPDGVDMDATTSASVLLPGNTAKMAGWIQQKVGRRLVFDCCVRTLFQ